MIDPKFYSLLARIFSNTILNDLAMWKESWYLRSIIKRSGYYRLVPEETTLRDLLDHLYDFLWQHYRFEYFYKNALANKILLGRHSLKTSALLSEFRAGQAKADLVILNGTSTVYEVKSELDTLDRLPNQIKSYLKVFDRVYVVTHESHLSKVERNVKEPVGIILLTPHYTLQRVRPALSNASNVDPSIIFQSLRRSEFSEIIRDEYGLIPQTSGRRFYIESQALFSQLSPIKAHARMVEKLRKRFLGPAIVPFIEALPRSFKLLCLARRLTPRESTAILSAMSADYRVEWDWSPDLTCQKSGGAHVFPLSKGQEI